MAPLGSGGLLACMAGIPIGLTTSVDAYRQKEGRAPAVIAMIVCAAVAVALVSRMIP